MLKRFQGTTWSFHPGLPSGAPGPAPATIHLTFTPHGRLVLVELKKVASEDFEVDLVLEATIEELVDPDL